MLADLAARGYETWRRDRPSIIAVDTETTGLAFWDEAFCVTVSWGDTSEGSKPLENHYFELAEFDSSAMVREILMETPRWVFHHSKFDLHKLLNAGLIDRDALDASMFEDTEALAHLLDENRPKGLKPLARDVLGEVTDEEEELKVVRRKLKLKKSDGYHVLPREIVIPYAIKDTDFTLRLFHYFIPQMEVFSDLSRLYLHEKHVTLTLLDMEREGMALDVDYVQTTAKRYGKEAVLLELSIRDMTGNEDFNPNSPAQLKAAFADRGIELESTDKAALGAMDDPLAQAILQLRSLRKMHGTYLMPMLEEQRGGVIHPHFRQHGTRTGRMSSGSAEV